MNAEEFEGVLRAARIGDEWAWTRLYGEFAGRVLGYLRARGAADPEDLLGEVFLQVARNLDGFTGDVVGFRAWLFTVAHRRLIDERRSRGRRPLEPVADLEDVEPSNGPERIVVNRMATAEIVSLLNELTDDQRNVLLLRIVGGLTIDEIGVALSKTRGAVKALQRRGLKKVEKKLRKSVPL
ncbi:MAG: sigma-70 family RNA polymerase sigma factor [Acidimicrobiia bacterium]|nr:sigma-70 family RNA polymerase sigma factor [Acidimicrobiia bacterium]